MVDEKTKAIDLALAQIEKQFGKGSIIRLGSKEAIVPIAVISTGSISFDAALGIGGFPRGRVVEVFGPESSGKTTVTLQVIAEAQKMGGMAAFIDAEHALDPIYAKRLGVEVDKLLDSRTRYGVKARNAGEPGCPVALEDVGGAAPRGVSARSDEEHFYVSRSELVQMVEDALRARLPLCPNHAPAWYLLTRFAKKLASCSATRKPPPEAALSSSILQSALISAALQLLKTAIWW